MLQKINLILVSFVVFCLMTGCSNHTKNDASKDSLTINGYEYVDLGLPSGLKWANRNIGAEAPDDFGNYYAWGEITSKSEYSNENSNTYGKSDILDISGNPAYDVATSNWGSSWRIPNEKEFQELISECAWKWTTLNDTQGYEVTGPNGNKIFLPASGGIYESTIDGVNSRAVYWSSTPQGSQYAKVLVLKNNHWLYYNPRYWGFAIRAVSK